MYGVYDRNKEIREAIRAGERALDSLQEANRQLNSAGNWGLVDIFGGNTISGLMKHMKVNNASRCVDDARRDLATFRDEQISSLMDLWRTFSYSQRYERDSSR